MNGYAPTPLNIVKEILEVAKLQPNEIHYDLGSGDGRFVREFTKAGAISTGFELDEELVRKTSDLNIICKDYMRISFNDPDIITAYLTKETEEEVISKFNREGKIGSRLILFVNGEITCLNK